MPKHIVRLLLVLLAVVLLGYAAKRFFTPASFYQYGHYRGASVAEIASDKPKYGTPKNCEKCHAAKYAEWSKGVHNQPQQGKSVKCEVCHGASSGRDLKGPFDNVATGPEHPRNLKMTIPGDSAKLCSLCHEKMPGRPAEQRQVDVASHAGNQQCTACHNAHSPRNFATVATGRKGDAAKGKALAGDCADCHGAAGYGKDLPGPNLAGQKEAYLAAALKSYKKGGGRSDGMMAGMVEDRSDTDLEDLAAYFAALPCQSARDGDKKAVAAGKVLAGKCATCHGGAGISAQAAWPNLAGQSSEHLVGALKAYKAGKRKNGMMEKAAKELSDQDTAGLAAYFANASCK